MRAPVLLSIDDSDDRAHAVELVRSGEVVAVPTDTVMGVSAALDRPQALAAIFRIKGRPSEKPLPVLLADPDDAALLTAPLSPVLRAFLRLVWPGAVTVVLPARDGLPAEVSGQAADGQLTVGLRVPDHPPLRTLIRELGVPLATTSANRSGEPPAVTADSPALRTLPGLAAILDGGPPPSGSASLVVELTGDLPLVRRHGPDRDRVLAAWSAAIEQS